MRYRRKPYRTELKDTAKLSATAGLAHMYLSLGARTQAQEARIMTQPILNQRKMREGLGCGRKFLPLLDDTVRWSSCWVPVAVMSETGGQFAKRQLALLTVFVLHRQSASVPSTTRTKDVQAIERAGGAQPAPQRRAEVRSPLPQTKGAVGVVS